MEQLVTIEVRDHIADIRLNRPHKMNALSTAMFEAVAAAARTVTQDTSVRAVVLSGNGRAFCAGLDLANMASPEFADDPFGEGRGGFYPNFFQAPAWAWKAVPVPVICALHGVAFGGGLQLALGADIRIAHPETQLSVMEIKWGLIPDMSASQTLRDLVPLDVAKELVYTGRVLEAPEADTLGLVTRLDSEPREAAMDLAMQIAARNPDAVARAKYLLDNSRDGGWADGLRLEERLQAQVLGKPNQIEAVKAEMEQRAAEFSPRDFGGFDQLQLP